MQSRKTRQHTGSRYFSREVRLQYLVDIDQQSVLIWANNSKRVWTKDELYKGSLRGIVPTNDLTSANRNNTPPEDQPSNEASTRESEEESVDAAGPDKGEEYLNRDFHKTRKSGRSQACQRCHLSLLHRSRFLAERQIRTQMRTFAQMSPLSCRYRSPAKNFQAFLEKLRDAGVDKLWVSTSKSFIVLIGLETYTRKPGTT